MVDSARDGKRAESGFPKEPWIQALADAQAVVNGSTILTIEKIKKQARFSQAKMERMDEVGRKYLGIGMG